MTYKQVCILYCLRPEYFVCSTEFILDAVAYHFQLSNCIKNVLYTGGYHFTPLKRGCKLKKTTYSL